MSLLWDGVRKLFWSWEGEEGLADEEKDANAEGDVGTGTGTGRVSVKEFKGALDAVESRRLSMRELLSLMGSLDEELPASLSARVFRYLCKDRNVLHLAHFLTVFEEDLSHEDVRAQQKFSYVASNLLAGGPTYLIYTLAASANGLNVLWDFLASTEELDARMAVNLCKVLRALVELRPQQMLDYLDTRKDACECFVKHVEHPAMVELIVILLDSHDSHNYQSRASPDRTFVHLLRILGREDIFELLAESFVDEAAKPELTSRSSAAMENIGFIMAWTAVKLQLEKPRYLGRALHNLDLYTDPRPVAKVLDAGLESKEDPSSTALRASLSMCDNLLRGLHQMGEEAVHQMDTMELEEAILERLDAILARLADDKQGGGGQCEGKAPVGLVRLEVATLISTCFECFSKASVSEAVRKGAFAALFEMFARHKHNSLLHVAFLAALKSLLTHNDEEVLQLVLGDFDLLRKLTDLWPASESSSESTVDNATLQGVLRELYALLSRNVPYLMYSVPRKELARFQAFANSHPRLDNAKPELELGVWDTDRLDSLEGFYVGTPRSINGIHENEMPAGLTQNSMPRAHGNHLSI